MKKLKFCALSFSIALIFLFSLKISPSFWGKIESIFHDIRAQYFIRSPETSSLKVKKGEVKYIQKQKKMRSFQSKIVFIDIDDKSLNQIGNWPWNRTVYSSFIKKIEEFNPSMILLDIYFPEKSEEDDEFAKTLEDYDNIGCVYNFTEQKNILIDPATKINIRKWAIKTNEKDTFEEIESILPTVHPISDKVFLGHDLIIKGADDKYKKIPEFVIHDGYLYPSITTILYLKYRGYSVRDLALEGNEFIVRDRIIPVNKKGLRYVDYYISESNRKTFRHISFVDILKERVKVNLDGKIVFVGVTASGIGSGTQDVLSTPIGEIYGIEFLANALLNIFEDRFIEEVPILWENIIFLFFGGMIGLLNYKLTGIKNLFITMSLIILMFFSSFWLYNLGILINFSKFLIGFFLIYVGMTFYKYILEKREKHQIRDMFSSYMSENIVAELIKDPKLAKLQGQKRNMTVLFSDIVGFTSFSEKQSPEYVVDRLNEYLNAMTDVIIENGGTLDKFVGDEIVVLFGAPLLDPEHAERAVKTAIQMRKKLMNLQRKWTENEHTKFDIGIGINSGEMLVGNIGAEGKKMDYTVIGDNVNLGARVEGLTRYYDVNTIITENTYNMINNYVDNCKFLDIVKVKGREKPTMIYELKQKPVSEQINELLYKAYENYKRQKWEEARKTYNKLLEINPNDKIAKLFLQRIDKYQNKSLEGKWDGIFVLDKK